MEPERKPISLLRDKKLIDELWGTIGFHRPMASFWYNYVLLIIVALPILLLNTWLIPKFILPYPSAVGYNSLVVTYFATFFSMMDMGTGAACERFVAQYSEINPRKALKYVQFFVWFQMFTGSAQILMISIFCFKYLIYTDLNYALWFFLIYSTTQFPGMLNSFTYSIRGFQRYDKANLVEIVQNVFFEIFTQIVFIYLGRYIGSLFPMYGELFGATVGFIIGKYVDDFMALGLASYYLKNILKPYNISLSEAIIPKFGREEIVNSLTFGFKTIGGVLFAEFCDFIVLMLMTEWLSGYVYILGYLQLAKSIASVATIRYNYQSLISESFNNGKKKLTEHTITEFFRNWWFITFFLALEIGMLVPPVLTHFGGEYAGAARILPLYLVARIMVTPPNMGTDILNGCNKPGYRSWGLVVEKITKLICIYIFLSPEGLVTIIGPQYLVSLYILHDIPPYIAITIFQFYFVHKKCVPMKVNIWKTFVAGTLASVPLIPVNLLIISLINMSTASGSTVLPLIIFGVAILCVFLVFPPLLFFFYGLFGGMDEDFLRDFKNCSIISGPSKYIVYFLFMAGRAGWRLSPFKNHFKDDRSEADREIEELMALVEQQKGLPSQEV